MAGVVGLAPGAVYPLAYRLSTSFSHPTFLQHSYNIPRDFVSTSIYSVCVTRPAIVRETRWWPRITRKSWITPKMRRPDYDRIKRVSPLLLIGRSTFQSKEDPNWRERLLLVDRIFLCLLRFFLLSMLISNKNENTSFEKIVYLEIPRGWKENKYPSG